MADSDRVAWGKKRTAPVMCLLCGSLLSALALVGFPVPTESASASRRASLESQPDQTVASLNHGPGWRVDNFYTLHEHAVTGFVAITGFGAGRILRMIDLPDAAYTNDSAEFKYFNPIPKEFLMPSPSGSGSPARDLDPWAFGMVDRFLDFVSADGVSPLKNRGQVAGHRPSQIRWTPEPVDRWKVESLELIGLVVHESPVAYASDRLPRMSRVLTMAVRPLDAFETFGLAELQKGHALVMRERDERVRVLGAIRATSQCTSCHDCKHNDLLGAFSYVLHKQ